METLFHAQHHDIAPQQITLEALVTEHFERAFLMFNTFVEDHRHCVLLSEGVFRKVAANGTPSTDALLIELVDSIRSLSEYQPLVEGLSREETLCWLLKDAYDLKYADIARKMGLDRDSVKVAIANVRSALAASL